MHWQASRNLTILILILAILLLFSVLFGAASAEVRYLDGQGGVHYVQTPDMVPMLYRGQPSELAVRAAIATAAAETIVQDSMRAERQVCGVLTGTVQCEREKQRKAAKQRWLDRQQAQP